MLALVGSGEYLPPMDPVDNYLLSHLSGPARVVCLPTAAGTEGPERIDYWSTLGVDHFRGLGVNVEAVPVIDQATANNEALAKTISAANFVYLSGGKPDYLYHTLRGSLAWHAILSVVARAGVLAGCSAGAMIMGEKFFGFPGWKAAFSFLPGVTIIPHYDEIPQLMLKSIRPIINKDLTIVGVERNTALVKEGERYEVVGSGGVTVWSKTHKARYTQGPLPTTLLMKG